MSGQKYLWIVERKIGNWTSWVGKISGKRAKGPMPNEEGKMTFGKGDYATDPRKYRIWKVPKGIRAGDVVKVQIWPEDNLVPMDYFLPEKRIGDDVSATMLHRISKIKRLELSRANRETDKVVIILAIALIIAMVAISILSYLVVKP